MSPRQDIRLNSESVDVLLRRFYETRLEIHFEFSRCFLRMFQNGPFINLGTDHPAPEFIPSRSPRLIEHVDSKRGTFARGVSRPSRFTERIIPGQFAVRGAFFRRPFSTIRHSSLEKSRDEMVLASRWPLSSTSPRLLFIVILLFIVTL